MSSFKFEKANLPTTRGLQPSVYDELLPHFEKGGDTLRFTEADMSRSSASAAAKRLMILDPARKFHSGFDAVTKKTYIRQRNEGEVPDKEEKPKETLSLAEMGDEEPEETGGDAPFALG